MKSAIVDTESAGVSNSVNDNNDFDVIFENHDANIISSDDGDVINGECSLKRVCNMFFSRFQLS